MLVSQYFENKFDCRIITQMREAEEGGGGRRTERQADTHRQTDRQRDRDRERGTEIEAENNQSSFSCSLLHFCQ